MAVFFKPMIPQTTATAMRASMATPRRCPPGSTPFFGVCVSLDDAIRLGRLPTKDAAQRLLPPARILSPRVSQRFSARPRFAPGPTKPHGPPHPPPQYPEDACWVYRSPPGSGAPGAGIKIQGVMVLKGHQGNFEGWYYYGADRGNQPICPKSHFAVDRCTCQRRPEWPDVGMGLPG